MEREKLLNLLATLFLSYRDLDKGYMKVLRIIKRLNSNGVNVDINNVQQIAYGYFVEGR